MSNGDSDDKKKQNLLRKQDAIALKLDKNYHELKKIYSKGNKFSQSFFRRIMNKRYAMKYPCLVFVGLLASMVQGAILPIYGVFLSKMLFVLNRPEQIIIPPDPETNYFDLAPIIQVYDKKGDSDMWCILMLVAAVTAFISSFLKRFTFGIVGESVTC